MARLEVLAAEQLQDPDLRAMMDASGDEMFGFGHCPDLFKAFLAFYRPAKYRGRLRPGRPAAVAAAAPATGALWATRGR